MSEISIWSLWIGGSCQHKGCNKSADNYCDYKTFNGDSIEDGCCKLLCEDHSKKRDIKQHYCSEHYKKIK